MVSDACDYQVARDVERKALWADLIPSAEEWRWSSLWRRVHGSAEQVTLLGGWPLPQPWNWKSLVNQPQHECEIEAIRRCIRRGQPFGSQSWVERIASQLGLESTLRAPHRPQRIPRAETAETQAVPPAFPLLILLPNPRTADCNMSPYGFRSDASTVASGSNNRAIIPEQTTSLCGSGYLAETGAVETGSPGIAVIRERLFRFTVWNCPLAAQA
ncbi:MAG: hypothetical protein NTY19_19695 [Planctomycetota bacterium]|nr:hypothetical protein [Planctomycetota bacterium]